MSDSSIVTTLPLLVAGGNARLDLALLPPQSCLLLGHGPCSCNDVRNDRINNELNLVLQHQFAPFQPRKFELIAGGLGGKALNLVVQLTVLGLEQFQHANRVDLVHAALLVPHRDANRNLAFGFKTSSVITRLSR